MHQAAGLAVDNAIDSEFIRAGVDAELVPVEMAHNSYMFAQFGLKFGQITHVVNALLKLADKAGRQTHDRHAAAQEFIGNQEVLMR
jgi:hypothetical protein